VDIFFGFGKIDSDPLVIEVFIAGARAVE